jgi:hypothetical protein
MAPLPRNCIHVQNGIMDPRSSDMDSRQELLVWSLFFPQILQEAMRPSEVETYCSY